MKHKTDYLNRFSGSQKKTLRRNQKFLKRRAVPLRNFLIRFLYKVFRYCGTKFFRRKIVIPSLCLDNRNFMKHDRTRLKKFLTLKQNCSTGNRDTPVCLDTRSFLRHKIVPLRSFSVL